MAPYRVLVVDDSAFMRRIISDLITQDEQFTIVATAVNGIEAVAAAAEHKPDVMTMDLEMPMMNGIEALQLVMKSAPVPIIMLSGISEDNTRDTIKALQFGAFDFIRKPSSAASSDINKVGEQLLEKLRIAVYAKRSKVESKYEQQQQEIAPEVELQAKKQRSLPLPAKSKDEAKPPAVPLHKPKLELTAESSMNLRKLENKSSLRKSVPEDKKTESATRTKLPKVDKYNSKLESAKQPVAAQHAMIQSPLTTRPSSAGGAAFKHLVAIGTSTGGPRALHEVISSLPGHFQAPVLVVQHMPPKFTRSLAQRLDNFSELTVVEAEQGNRVKSGYVYIAPGGMHMGLAKDSLGYYIELTEQPLRNGHRPSVDVLFESLLAFPELERHAVIMTGMGSDGAKGMKALAEQGITSTIAESEDTCIVYGMPRSAVECGAAHTVLPLQGIAPRLVSAVLM